MSEKCFACKKRLLIIENAPEAGYVFDAYSVRGDKFRVGPTCFEQIKRSGSTGFPVGAGPVLTVLREHPPGFYPAVRKYPVSPEPTSKAASGQTLSPVDGTLTEALAKDILLRLVGDYPGLVSGEDEVPGADLVEWIANELHIFKADPLLNDRCLNGTPEGDPQMRLLPGQKFSNSAFITRAEDEYANDDIAVDYDVAEVSRTEDPDKAWVAAWVWVELP